MLVTAADSGVLIIISAAVPHLGAMLAQRSALMASQLFLLPSEASVKAMKTSLSFKVVPQT
jgi:hypothetical protein